MHTNQVEPLCPVFGQCGGCAYQHLPYSEELAVKHTQLSQLLIRELGISPQTIEPIVPSPDEYFYRNRLDLKLKKVKTGEVFIGFTPVGKKGILPIDSCFIAKKEVTGFISQLKVEAIAKLTPKYRNANLTVKTGDDGRVRWGGIGKKSCRLPAAEYLWTEINHRKIFYSLDTFFQANLSILPKLMDTIISFDIWEKDVTFLDLYGGVGLFTIALADSYQRAVLIENCTPSIEGAMHNVSYHQLKKVSIISGTVEDHLEKTLSTITAKTVAMIDPPRAGLSQSVRDLLATAKGLDSLIYLSCHPESLARDLKVLCESSWKIDRIIPFDFFPKTSHLETLVLLKR